MTKQQKLFLSLTIKSTLTKTPIYNVFVNGLHISCNEILDIDATTKKHCYTVMSDVFDKIEVELTNKSPMDTVVVDNQIVEDLLLIIDDLKIDDINLLNNLSKISVYKDTNGNIQKTFNYITFNGKMTIKIHKNPIYTNWLANYL